MEINVQNFLQTLPIMLRCIGGILAVMLLLIIITSLLNRITAPKKGKEGEK